jgi:rieske iron-sulfur protein
MADTTAEGRPACSCHRRSLLKLFAGIGLGLPRLAAADGEEDAPPRENDWLVVAFGARAGEPISPADLDLGARQAFAYPMDPSTGVIRNGSRLNQVIVVRLDPAELAPSTRARSADGVVAYSAVCTHTGCDVSDWYGDVRRFKCPCHESEFDPKDGAEVIGGPAPLPLAALPLKVVDGKLAVAGVFEGRVGFMQPGGLDPFGGL